MVKQLLSVSSRIWPSGLQSFDNRYFFLVYLYFQVMFEVVTALMVSEASYKMIINHAWNLHKRVDNSRPDAAKASLHQILAYELWFWCFCWHLTCIAKSILYWLVVYKFPAIVAEWTKFLLDLQINELFSGSIMVFVSGNSEENSCKDKLFFTNQKTERIDLSIWNINL